jgi:hypothetical protein
MSWKTERDLLIAQTMAFVQSVTGKQPDAALNVNAKTILETAPAVEAAPLEAAKLQVAEIVTSSPAAPPREVQVNIQIARTVFSSDGRTGSRPGCPTFARHSAQPRARGMFQRHLTKLRTAIENDSTPDPSDRTPPAVMPDRLSVRINC